MPIFTGTGTPKGKTFSLSSSSSPKVLLTFKKPSSSPSPSSFKPASLSSFEEPSILDDLDLIDELTSSVDRYQCDVNNGSILPITEFSDILRINIERIRERVTGTPGRNVVIAACFRFAVSHLFRDDRIKDIILTRKRFLMSSSDIPTEINVVLDQMINSFKLPIPAGSRHNASVPREYKNMLAGLAGEIGLPTSTLAVISIMMVLSTQVDCNRGDVKRMSTFVDNFWLSITARCKASQALLDVYGL